MDILSLEIDKKEPWSLLFCMHMPYFSNRLRRKLLLNSIATSNLERKFGFQVHDSVTKCKEIWSDM